MPEPGPELRVGVVSDTHGYLDPAVVQIFGGVDHILHAGDVGKSGVLAGLRAIAPLTAVRGNIDGEPELLTLPERIDVELGGVQIQLVHRLADACPEAETRLVVFGHSHRAECTWREHILYLNPGAAGRQGFHRLRTVAMLLVGPQIEATSIVLGPKATGSLLAKRRTR